MGPSDPQTHKEAEADFRFSRKVVLASALVLACFVIPYFLAEWANCEISCAPDTWAINGPLFALGGFFAMFPGAWLFVLICNRKLKLRSKSALENKTNRSTGRLMDISC